MKTIEGYDQDLNDNQKALLTKLYKIYNVKFYTALLMYLLMFICGIIMLFVRGNDLLLVVGLTMFISLSNKFYFTRQANVHKRALDVYITSLIRGVMRKKKNKL